jgi:GDPmannose 4,6-dehydratase
MNRVLVTGVTGQDGSLLAERFARDGHEVVGIARNPPTAPLEPGIEILAGDIEDGTFVARVVAERRPAFVYHFAGQSSVGASFLDPTGTFRSIALGTLNVLDAARRAAAPPRVLLASSGEVFGNLGDQPAREDTPFRPLSPYAAAKASASHLGATYRKAFGLYVSVAFFYNHESPRRPAQFVTKKIVRGACRIARGLQTRLELGDTSVVRDWGWAPEYMDAAQRILALETPQDFVIATGQSCSLDAFVEAVFSSLGLDAKDHVRSDPALIRPAEIPAMRADPTCAAARLAWHATVRVGEVARRMVEAELAELDDARR